MVFGVYFNNYLQNSYYLSRLFKKNVLTLGHVYLFSRKKKEVRETNINVTEKYSLIGCFPMCPNQDLTLNLVCALLGIELEIFGVWDDAPTH